MKTLSIKATTLTPFAYASLAVPMGVATIPHLIGDRAMAFALCAALGMLKASPVLRSKPAYKEDLGAMPWRLSAFVSQDAVLLPPLARRSGLEVEGGYQKRFRDAAGSGNFKEFFYIQEVAPGATYTGLLHGEDPFAIAGTDAIVVRVGNNRTGQVLLEKASEENRPVRLNAATASLFGRKLPVSEFLLHEIQLTPFMEAAEAAEEMAQWH